MTKSIVYGSLNLEKETPYALDGVGGVEEREPTLMDSHLLEKGNIVDKFVVEKSTNYNFNGLEDSQYTIKELTNYQILN